VAIGLIAGNGTFPFLVLRAARRLGHDVVAVAIKGEASPELETLARDLDRTTLTWIELGQLGKAIKALKDGGVSQAVMAGQVKHVKLFGGVMPDFTLLAVLGQADGQQHGLADRGRRRRPAGQRHHLMNSTELLKELVAPAGVLSRARPTSQMQADFDFGYRVADAIAGVDIGQTVIVKERAVVAVEGMEGTDAAIARAGSLAGAGTRVIKVAKPKQDMRFDVPVVGVATIEGHAARGCRCDHD
jgi:DUF1009 family protein